MPDATADMTARELLDVYDLDLSGKPRTDEAAATARRIGVAGSFAATAFMMGHSEGQDVHALTRSFLMALVNPASPDLDYLRAVNQPPPQAEPSPHRTHRDPGPTGWYWSNDPEAEYLSGPHSTREAAVTVWLGHHGTATRAELEAEGDVPLPVTDDTLRQHIPHVARYRRPQITTDIFDLDEIADRLADKNVEATYGEDGLDLPGGDIGRDLEARLATALYDWLDAHDLWGRFRGLEDQGDME